MAYTEVSQHNLRNPENSTQRTLGAQSSTNQKVSILVFANQKASMLVFAKALSELSFEVTLVNGVLNKQDKKIIHI